jgi:hypothetical protein
VAIGTYELRLSTTDAVPGALDSVLDRNRGDDEVLVYSGPIRWKSDGVGPREGPREFDYVVDFQDPFPYDPSGGKSLLVEEIFIALHNAPLVDSHLDPDGEGARWQAGRPHTARAAFAASDNAWVRQFEFVSEPRPTVLQAGDADMDCDFDQMDLVQVQLAAKYMTAGEATWGEGDWNGAPGGSVEKMSPPLGDGQFNQLDIVAALNAATYLHGSYCTDGGAAAFAVPELSTCLLLALGLTGVLFVRSRKRRLW